MKVQDDIHVRYICFSEVHAGLYSGYKMCCFFCVHQELVNLLLSGRAVSNVFDNDMELDSGNGNMTLLKGVKGHCDVGLLSLFEHYNICKVSG